MDPRLYEWLNLALRWFHVVAGVLWIGQTAFFSWLDSRLRLEVGPDGKEQVWMVHSGGFYVVDRQPSPEILPRKLHWFRWEAALTWLSGFFLLVVVYYLGGGLLVEYGSELDHGAAVAIGLGALAAGWVVYDLLWISPLARREGLAAAVSFLLLVAAAWALSQVLSGRAAYIHVGAMLGTVMAANVWMRILPAQRQMLSSTEAGERVDLTLGMRAKQRSGHNTFLALPVIFIMISNHFPTTSYGHRLNWLMLVGFLVVGFAARKLMNLWNERS